MGLESILGEDQPVEVTLWPEGTGVDAKDIVFTTTVRECAGNKFRVDLPPKPDKTFWSLATPGTVAGVVVPGTGDSPLVIYPVIDTVWRDEEYQQGLWFRLISDRQTREQRRQHVRVEIAVPIEIEFGVAPSVKKIEGVTLDISGGGMKFLSTEKFTENREITLCAQFEPDTPVWRFRADVVYSRESAPTPAGKKKIYITASRFTKLGSREEQAIMHECFRQQLGLGEK